MTDYTPLDEFTDPVQTYDLNDLVLGGDTGPSNQPIEKLTNRTWYLYKRLGGYLDVSDVSGSATIDNTFSNKLIAVNASANVTLTLAALNTFVKGCRIAFVASFGSSGGPFWLNVVTPGAFHKGNISRTNIWLYDGEMIEIVAGSSYWHWTVSRGNFDKIGECDLRRFQPSNTFLGDGTPGYLRAKFPRLIEAINGSFVTDANWLSDPFRYRQQFSSGNGSTTFRAADYRAMTFRALDGGRGVDLGRFDNVPGGYEDDANKAHTHVVNDPGHQHGFPHQWNEDGGGHIASGGNTDEGIIIDKTATATTGITLSSSGDTEVKVKNVGFNPYIYY